MAETPDHIFRFRDVLTAGDLERARRNFQRAIARPWEPQPIPLLLWRVRLRLWRAKRLDHVAIWLAGHGHEDAAVRLWRMFRMW